MEQPAAAKPPAGDVRRGVDISYPQCGRRLKDVPNGFVIVGVNGGKPFTPNPCLAAQWGFALRQAAAAVYVNTADPGRDDPAEYGVRAVGYSLRLMRKAGVPPGVPVWLDVETLNTWRGGAVRHREVLSAMLAEFAAEGHPVGVYAARSHWLEITGGIDPGVPAWLAIGQASAQTAMAQCDRVAFGGVKPSMVQRIGIGSDGKPLDRNVVCPDAPLGGMLAG